MSKNKGNGAVNPDNKLSQTEQSTQEKTGSYRNSGLDSVIAAFNSVARRGGFGAAMKKEIVTRPVHMIPLRDEAGKHISRKLAWVFRLSYWAFIPPVNFDDPDDRGKWSWQLTDGDAVMLHAVIAHYNSYRAVREQTIKNDLIATNSELAVLQSSIIAVEAKHKGLGREFEDLMGRAPTKDDLATTS